MRGAQGVLAPAKKQPAASQAQQTPHTVLGDGARDLQPGDCFAMPGVDHAPGRRAYGRACCRSASVWHPRAEPSGSPSRRPGRESTSTLTPTDCLQFELERRYRRTCWEAWNDFSH